MWGNMKERDNLEDAGIDGRVILRWIFTKWDVGAWTGLIWIRTGTGGRQAGTCECNNETLGTIKCWEFLG